MAFAGDRDTAGHLLTPRQRVRLEGEYETGPNHVNFELAGMSLVGTDHVFRLNKQRMEVFSGMPRVLHDLLSGEPDIKGCHHMLPGLSA